MQKRNEQYGNSAVQHVPLCLRSLLAANSQFTVFIGHKMQLTENELRMLITCVMRHARTYKLQISGPTVHSYTGV